MKKLLLLILFFLTLQVYTQANQAGQTDGEENNQEEKSSKGFFSGEFVNRSEFYSYYRSTGLVEITGNEQTFTAGIRLDFDYIRKFNDLDFMLTIDSLFLEQLSLKGRLYENFNPPTILLNEVNITLPVTDWINFKLGILNPLLDVMPFRNYFVPVVFKTGANTYTFDSNIEGPADNFVTADISQRSYINQTFSTGYRDDPLPYIIPLQNDTGLSLNLDINSFVFSLLFSNGEANLDSNSAKTFSILIGFDDEHFDYGVIGQIGNFGSVPIKEYQNYIKSFFYFSEDFTDWGFKVGLEGLLHLHGIRDLGSFEGRAYQAEFLYTDGFFGPFSVYNDGTYDASSQLFPNMLYGLSGLVFFDLNISVFKYTFHFSFYDPNLLTDNKGMYKPRFRIFNRLGLEITPFIDLYFSHTFTHDEIFYSLGQFFDRESRENHPLLDQDFFGGLIFRL